jgi:Fic family protein
MERGLTGRYETTVVGGERVPAFVPDPLPPKPALTLNPGLQALVESALLALGRLDGISALVPDVSLLLYSYIRKEAVLSSQIEGTQSSLSDLLLYELEEQPGVPMADVIEVSNYVAALDHGLERLRSGGLPISNRLLCEIHGILLARGRGSGKRPGEFRTSQNWLGGTRPGNAVYVPPPHQLVPDCMAELERFIHGDSALSVLVRAALAHVQFETIHPFLDGNGRVGRLLITLFLCDARVLNEPLLYLSLWLKENRAKYYELLDGVRRDGNWEAWLEFFLEGVQLTADSAVYTARALLAVFANDRNRIAATGRRSASALRLQEALKERPLATLADIAARTGLSFPAASAGMSTLAGLGIVRELTGKRRNRVFAYGQYLDILTANETGPF